LSDVLTGYCAIRGSFDPPRCLNPFPLCPAFPNSLDGRDSVEYYGFAAPPVALPIRLPLFGEPQKVPALLA